MHRTANAMAYKLPNDAEPVPFYVLLNSPRNINHSLAWKSLAYSFIKCPFCDIHQALSLDRASPHRDGPGGITDEAIIDDPNIQAYDVPKFNPPVPCQSMDNLFINRNANVARVLAVAQKCTFCSVMLNAVSGKLVDLPGSHARLDRLGNLV